MKLNAQTLAALRTFDASARAGSFTHAALELHISAAAVSQQIKQLEQSLKLNLFNRHARGITLTDDGKVLFETVSPSLNKIATTIDTLQQNHNTLSAIRVKSTPSFAFKWLVPRLADFYQQYPDIPIQVFADAAFVDKESQDFDLAIDFSPTPYIDSHQLKPQLLMAESLIPVASPQYAAQYDWNDPQSWQGMCLLHDAMPWPGGAPDVEWRYWFEQQGLTAHFCQNAHYFNRTDLAMEAAIAGQGVALARNALLGNVLIQGYLIAPFAAIDSASGYYLLTNQQIDNSAKQAALLIFTDWLTEQVSKP